VLTWRRLADSILIAGFLGLLVIPSLGLGRSGSEEVSRTENRKLAPMPPLELLRAHPKWFLKQFGQYFSDHFFLRNDLIRLHAWVEYYGLGQSPSPSVILGKDPWLFFIGDGKEDAPFDLGDELVQYRRLRPLSEEQLATLRRRLELRRRWAQSLGARFLFVIPPNKTTIYDEYMPDSLNRLSGRSQTDQVVEMLRAQTAIDVVDLRPALESARDRERVYAALDTHWNAAGAHVAYSQIMSSLAGWFPALEPIPRDVFRANPVQTGGDLPPMMGLEGFLSERNIDLKLPCSRFRSIAPPVPKSAYAALTHPVTATEVDDPALPTALVLHDSFMLALQPFLAEHFRTAVYVWSYRIDPRVAEQFKPQVVILECVERSVHWLADVGDDVDVFDQPGGVP
jgi:hypothetical protein